MYYILNLLDCILAGYSISTIAFLLISFFSKALKTLRSRYLNIANFFALFLSVTVTVFAIINYAVNYKTLKDNPEGYAFFSVHFYTVMVAEGLIPLVFLARQLRRNILLTIIVALSVNWFPIYQQVYFWITQIYRDYLPSSWSVYYESSLGLYISITAILYFAITYFLAMRTKTNA